jgi:hypothetical protein
MIRHLFKFKPFGLGVLVNDSSSIQVQALRASKGLGQGIPVIQIEAFRDSKG